MNVEKIHWYGHDSFRIEDAGKQIYIDPWKMPDGLPGADVILVTHGHYDHYSADDVNKLSTPRTTVVGPADVAEKVRSETGAVPLPIAPGETVEVEGLKVTAVAAYNIGKKFHPKASGWVGFIVTLSDGTRLYHAGDTDCIAEMKGLGVEVALLPVSGTYVMTAQEAIAAAEAIGAGVVIPMHYGRIVGSEADAEKFEQGFKGETVIKQPEA
ncbi:MAG: MBL fold metallo-hydrolase [Anaerolineaceae bacterium]|nr:MBL fold metallo-hydrolase [Anaerolineaceae bacterium]